MTSIIIKADEFKYPSRVELQGVRAVRPRLVAMGFPYVNEVIELLENIGSMEDVQRRSDLYWWDRCLTNRLGRLEQSYTAAVVHHSRGVPDELSTYNQQQYVNRTQFGYYSENFFYFFISVRDTVAQLLNVYLKMGFKEFNVSVKRNFCDRMTDLEVKDLFLGFLSDTKLTTDYRNRMAHRFLITLADHRASITYADDTKTFSGGTGSYILPSELLVEIKQAMVVISKFLQDLKSQINP